MDPDLTSLDVSVLLAIGWARRILHTSLRIVITCEKALLEAAEARAVAEAMASQTTGANDRA